ncbi:hypothetical protein NECAME_08916 [Necator americanus]|uniref:Uncharacterized protein n=1 Tax=Necator americanus TaxID=51031 RepID=W2TIE7_NECAM|nr:hypothetical protein NECAME_08916 [Necator americanus]ETN80782.1 hypothetical protein NECAME_08916 [Necator americanus]
MEQLEFDAPNVVQPREWDARAAEARGCVAVAWWNTFGVDGSVTSHGANEIGCVSPFPDG